MKVAERGEKIEMRLSECAVYIVLSYFRACSHFFSFSLFSVRRSTVSKGR